MTPSPVILCNDLISDILSSLPVKSLLRFRSVCKSWKTLISNPAFVKLHLNISSTRNPQFTLIIEHNISNEREEHDYSVIPYSIRSLLENPSFTLYADSHYSLNDKGCFYEIGSCNGLICLAGHEVFTDDYKEYSLCVWNPATRKISENFGYFRDYEVWPPRETFEEPGIYNFKFGCDNSTGIYKVVASCYDPLQMMRSIVRILNVGDNVWRDIESFPVVPLHLDSVEYQSYSCFGVYLSDTLNWLAIHDNFQYENIEGITVEQFVIVSLHLGTEKYNQFTLPRGFDEVPSLEPTIVVCGGYLCFSYSYKNTHFVMWQMKKFGVEESWTQFLKISFLQLDFDMNNLMFTFLSLVPLFLYEDGDTLILESNVESHATLYNWRDNKVQRTKVNTGRTSDIICWFLARGFVESLVWIC